jgi:hypothetical protein
MFYSMNLESWFLLIFRTGVVSHVKGHVNLYPHLTIKIPLKRPWQKIANKILEKIKSFTPENGVSYNYNKKMKYSNGK